MDIILAHVHFSESDRAPGYEERFVRLMESSRIAGAVIFANDLPGETTNDCVSAMVRKFPRKLFGTAEINSSDTSVLEHMKRHVRDSRMRGFKLFPSKCMCYPDDRRMFPIYETAVELDAPIVFHAGRVPPDFDCYGLNKYAQPIALDEVAARFPSLRIVISHAGNPLFEQTLMIGRRPNVFIEMTGASAWDPENGYSKRLFAVYGPERIMSGGPLHEHEKLLPRHGEEMIAALGRWKMDGDSIGKILGGNAAKVFKLPAADADCLCQKNGGH